MLDPETLATAWPRIAPILQMRVHDSVYLLYVAAFAGVFWVIPGRKLKEWALILGSLAFIYRYVDPFGGWFMLAITILLYLLTLGGRVSKPKATVITVGLVVMYWWMLPGGLGPALMHLPREWLPTVAKIIGHTTLVTPLQKVFLTIFLPIRCVAYVWEVALGKTQPRGLRSLVAWALFFPGAFCAPFLWHEPYQQQTEKWARPAWRTVGYGMRRMVVGFLMVSASFAWAMLYPIARFSHPQFYSSAEMWVAGYGWIVHFYLMGAGFADINIGMGALLGYTVPENLTRPLRRTNMLEFWRSWNIMVGEFLKSWVYIPLGGNRKGEARTHLNYYATMFACGLWHGINPTFMVWGLLHGASLSVNRWWRGHFGKAVVKRIGERPARLLGWAVTFHFVVLTFTMLYSASTGKSFETCMATVLRMLALA